MANRGILVTGDPDGLTTEMQKLKPAHIDLRQKTRGDIKKFVEDKLERYDQLKNFDIDGKNKVAVFLSEMTGGILAHLYRKFHAKKIQATSLWSTSR